MSPRWLDAEDYLHDLEREQAEWFAKARADWHRRVEVEHAALRAANDARAAAADAEDPLPASFPAIRAQIERESLRWAHESADAAVDLMAEHAEMHLEVLRREIRGVAVH